MLLFEPVGVDVLPVASHSVLLRAAIRPFDLGDNDDGVAVQGLLPLVGSLDVGHFDSIQVELAGTVLAVHNLTDGCIHQHFSQVDVQSVCSWAVYGYVEEIFD